MRTPQMLEFFVFVEFILLANRGGEKNILVGKRKILHSLML